MPRSSTQTLKCSMNGSPVEGLSDAILADGEWVSWDWIKQQIRERKLKVKYPNADTKLALVFEELIEVAIAYKKVTGRYLPVFGELGEIFAEMTFGIKRHKPKTAGSDGRLGNDLVEIKTITPESKTEKITVRREGNFSKLLVVKINEAFGFEARMLDRKEMSKGSGGKHARVSWTSIKPQKT